MSEEKTTETVGNLPASSVPLPGCREHELREVIKEMELEASKAEKQIGVPVSDSDALWVSATRCRIEALGNYASMLKKLLPESVVRNERSGPGNVGGAAASEK